MPKNRNDCPCTRCTVKAYDGMRGNCRLCNTKGRPESCGSMTKLRRGSTASTPDCNRTTTLLARIFTNTTSAPFTNPRSGSKLRVIMYLIATLVHLRIPHHNVSKAVNHALVMADSEPGSYFALQYSWRRSADVNALQEIVTVEVRIFAFNFDVGSSC